MADTRVMELPDGRELAWLETGKPRGFPVFMFHGTPGSRLQVSFDPKAIAASGVRFIAPDRPGYGHSSFHPDRTLLSWASDVAALADHLRVERFAVAGLSGGGPHAAACAAALPDRVAMLGLVSAVGPIGEPELAGGMVGLNRALTTLAVRAPFALLPLFAVQDFAVRRWPEKTLAAARKRLPAPDAAVLAQADVVEAMATESKRAPATAARAGAQDFALFARPWGFRPQDISVAAHIWHGDADENVLPSHARFFAQRIPQAELHECPGEGHMLYHHHVEEILRTLATA
ncbi:MAG TPA: alpha/beta hydrolase [Acidimicrobiales bacterium]|jgi:pimeloyl-ACP methyl ester carboxylesterase|nr:alpha/beta hydrolase [Acidimicrobiales bacterium]